MSREYRAGFLMNDSYDCYVGNLCAAESEEQTKYFYLSSHFPHPS